MDGVAPQSLRDLKQFEADLKKHLPRYVFRALAAGMFREGKRFKKEFRGSLTHKFKTGGKKVGNTFKVYTAGDTLRELKLGVFTMWGPAEIYETGGMIRGNPWLVFPVTPKAYTAAGRVKRSWRKPGNPSKFREEKFKDLRPIKVRGGILLVRDRGVTKKGRLGRVTKKRGVEAIEPVFMLIRQTKRKKTLNFFSDFAAFAGGAGGDRLQAAVHDALQAIARKRE